MRIYDIDPLAHPAPYQGLETGDDALNPTEQEYIPMAVQVNRFIAAGERLVDLKRELFDIGWDENFNMNTVSVPPQRRPNFTRVDAQEMMEEYIESAEQILAAKNTVSETQQNPPGERPTSSPETPNKGIDTGGQGQPETAVPPLPGDPGVKE